MPAERTSKKPRAGPSAPRPGPAGATETHKPLALEHRTPDGIPGLSKLKASIRQTKRFLAKEGLEPGLKIQTQRRLESLEADLAKAEKRSVEMKNGTKYHKVKFFERQKLLRIIKKQQRQIEKTESSSTKVQAAEVKLEHARIMLNYVINFPNTEKYISLFPTSSNDPSEPSEEIEEDTKARLPKYLDSKISSEELDKPSKRRLELLHEVQRLMGVGKLSKMPEVEIAAGEGRVKLDLDLGTSGAAGEGVESKKGISKGEDEGTTKKDKKDKKKKARNGQEGDEEVAEVNKGEVAGVKAGDDFFED